MAIVNGNLVMDGVSGKLGGNLVFYRRGGKQLVRKAPALRDTHSIAQLDKQQRFKEAVAYAKQRCADPATAAAWMERLKPGQSLYHGVISAWMKGEEV